MAIKKIKIGNTTHDIRDDRIVGVTSTVSPSNGSVVTSGGVYNAIQNAGGVVALPLSVYTSASFIESKVVNEQDNSSLWEDFCQFIGFQFTSTVADTIDNLNEMVINKLNSLCKIYLDNTVVFTKCLSDDSYQEIIAHQLSALGGPDSAEDMETEDYMKYAVFENESRRFVIGVYNSHSTRSFFAIKSIPKTILIINSAWSTSMVISYNKWYSAAKYCYTRGIMEKVKKGAFEIALFPAYNYHFIYYLESCPGQQAYYYTFNDAGNKYFYLRYEPTNDRIEYFFREVNFLPYTTIANKNVGYYNWTESEWQDASIEMIDAPPLSPIIKYDGETYFRGDVFAIPSEIMQAYFDTIEAINNPMDTNYEVAAIYYTIGANRQIETGYVGNTYFQILAFFWSDYYDGYIGIWMEYN